MLQTIVRLYGSRDFKGLETFLNENADDQVLLQWNCKDSNMMPNMEIRGIGNLLNFFKAMSNSVPDDLFSLSDITIRNSQKYCNITANFEYSATVVVDMLVTSKTTDELCSEKTSEVTIDLGDLSDKVEKLDLSAISSTDGKLAVPELKFTSGSVRPTIYTRKGTGYMVLHLNSDKKIYLWEKHILEVHDDKEIVAFKRQK